MEDPEQGFTSFRPAPDGREILGEMPIAGARDLVRVPIEGGEPRAIFQTAADETEAALSPDGRWLAYTSDATGRQEIWLRPFDGGGTPTRFSRNGATSRRGARTAPSSSSAISAPSRYTPTYAVGPDGRFLMRGGVPARGSGEVVLVLDWFSELERLAPTHGFGTSSTSLVLVLGATIGIAAGCSSERSAQVPSSPFGGGTHVFVSSYNAPESSSLSFSRSGFSHFSISVGVDLVSSMTTSRSR